MNRRAMTIGLSAAALGLLVGPPATHAQALTDQQTVLQRASVTVADMRRSQQFRSLSTYFHRARAVLIIPRFYKGSFFVGGAGGRGVLLVHDGHGRWSAPAFFTIGSASFGLQIGIEQSEMVLFIMNQRALDAVVHNKVSLGVDGGLAVANVGGNVGGATTTAAGADVLAWAQSQGAYVGISLEGSVLAPDPEADSVYYRRNVTTDEVLYRLRDTEPTAVNLQRTLSSVA